MSESTLQTRHAGHASPAAIGNYLRQVDGEVTFPVRASGATSLAA